MEDYDIMTREEAEKKMEVLRQIFPIVRLVRGYTVMDLNGKQERWKAWTRWRQPLPANVLLSGTRMNHAETASARE